MSMEFKMTTDLATALPNEIIFNFDELKTALEERLHYYNTLVVTEDTIKDGKEERAKLNKLKTAVDTYRKDVKKRWNAPYNAFEARVKELTALIDQPIAAIDGQLKGFEETKKAEKQQEIQEYYNATVAPYLQTVIPLERIQKPDWLNATKSIKKVQLEIVEAIAKVTADLECLNTMPSDDFTAAVRAKYMETLDITAALNHRKALQAAATAFDTVQNNPPRNTVMPPAPDREPEREPMAPPAKEEKLYTLRLEMHLTKAQADCLKKYLIDNGIDHHKI